MKNMKKFNENGVITGVVDSFCLSCETYLKTEDIIKHISKPSHQKTFQDTTYVDRYKGECIRKMKIGYYCEVCNMMIQTLAKMALHVEDATHINNMNRRLLKRLDGGIIVFDDILIEINNWHGLADGSCLICDIDFTNESEHKNNATHILNLIQSKLELNKNRFVYRKIYEDYYNCLICNTIVTIESKDTHCDLSLHNDNYMKCQQNKKLFEADNRNDEAKTDKNLDAVSDEIKKNVNCDNSKENFEETEESAENSTSVTQYALDKSLLEDDGDKLLSPSEALAEATAFAKKNYLKYKRNGTYCKYCNITISSTLKRMREHVAEASHQAKLQNKMNKKLNKVPLPTFVDNAVSVQNIFHHDIIVNNEYCLSMLSFSLISINNGRIRCQICETNILSNEIEKHKHTVQHQRAMSITPVLIDFETEFVREIKPHLYHCGFCNFVEATLDQMKNHLKSVNHYERKANAQRRLQINLQEIEKKREQNMFLNYMRLFH